MNLMSAKQQKTRKSLTTRAKGEARSNVETGLTAHIAEHEPEIATRETDEMMEEICSKANSQRAYRRVKGNRGAPGVDGMTTEALGPYLKEHWPSIKRLLLEGRYSPQAVRRVEIPKSTGGKRQLGIPSVTDRFIQQAVAQVLERMWEPTFSDNSYGFRPGRSAHQAVAKAQEHINNGYRYVVDIDLEKFFDRVNHDKLMGEIAKRVRDKRVLRLIRGFLNAGVLENGLVQPRTEGTPQGGPLSPLLSNIMLDLLDRELERRGHRFVRYADDCNILMRSRRAGERVMQSISRFITRKLKLKVNSSKSAVARVGTRKFLGFSFTVDKQCKRRIAPESLDRFKSQIRRLTGRTVGHSLEEVVRAVAVYSTGWLNYYGFCQTPSVLAKQEHWIRRRLRALCWVQWKRGRNRYDELHRRGVPRFTALQAAAHRSPWKVSTLPGLCMALPNDYFHQLGLPHFVCAEPA